jgi:hypothetical protein
MQARRLLMFRRPQLVLTDFQNHKLDDILSLTWLQMNYLGCEDCDRLNLESDEKGLCRNPKDGCKKLLEMLEKA